MRQLCGATVLITGGSSGIGRALAQVLHGDGAKVVIASRDPRRLAAVERELPGVESVAADLTRKEDRVRLAETVEQRFPGLSVLVHAAGVQHPVDHTADVSADARNAQLAQADEEIALNCAAVVDLTLRFWPLLRRGPASAIVLISSGLALAPKKSAPVYCASKAFVRAFAKSLRYQCDDGAPNVQVMEVIPPVVDTPMTAGRGTGKIPPAAVAQAVMAGLRRGRDEVNVGRVKWLRVIQRVSPALAERLLRNG